MEALETGRLARGGAAPRAQAVIKAIIRRLPASHSSGCSARCLAGCGVDLSGRPPWPLLFSGSKPLLRPFAALAAHAGPRADPGRRPAGPTSSSTTSSSAWAPAWPGYPPDAAAASADLAEAAAGARGEQRPHLLCGEALDDLGVELLAPSPRAGRRGQASLGIGQPLEEQPHRDLAAASCPGRLPVRDQGRAEAFRVAGGARSGLMSSLGAPAGAKLAGGRCGRRRWCRGGESCWSPVKCNLPVPGQPGVVIRGVMGQPLA